MPKSVLVSVYWYIIGVCMCVYVSVLGKVWELQRRKRVFTKLAQSSHEFLWIGDGAGRGGLYYDNPRGRLIHNVSANCNGVCQAKSYCRCIDGYKKQRISNRVIHFQNDPVIFFHFRFCINALLICINARQGDTFLNVTKSAGQDKNANA